jgi:hypothetical protein
VRHDGEIRSTETDWLPYGIPHIRATRCPVMEADMTGAFLPMWTSDD